MICYQTFVDLRSSLVGASRLSVRGLANILLVICVLVAIKCSLIYWWTTSAVSSDLEATPLQLVRRKFPSSLPVPVTSTIDASTSLDKKTKRLPLQSSNWSAPPISDEELTCPYVPPDPEEIKDIFSNETIKELKEQVSGFNKSRPVVLIMANEPALYLVANWICIARMTLSSPPTENLLVTIHDSLHGAEYLMGRGINSVSVVMSEQCLNKGKNVLQGWYKALVSRMLTIMLLTEWGFDVMVHDPDAYIIRDPLQLYSDIIKAKDPHIISQKGKWPIRAKLKWGFALVLGAILYRSSPKLRYIWKKLSEHRVLKLDDQREVNTILLDYGMKWETSHSIYNSTFGQTRNGIRAVALDANYSFRGNVSTEMEGIDTDELVILHPLLGHKLKRKMYTLHKMNLWQLRVSEKEFFALLEDDNAGSGEQWFDRICKKKGQLQVSFDGVKRTVLI